LQCLHEDYEDFVCTSFHNEIFWYSDCTHIPVVGQMALSPSISSFACKFCHSPPLCVPNYLGWIYYVVHRLPSISRVTIHFEVHKHLIANGKCRGSMDEIKRLIVKEVNCMPNAKIYLISLGASKTFLATYLLDG
jgi:hypothetical protein